MSINFKSQLYLKTQIIGIFIAALLLTSCEKTPIDFRTPVTLPVYTKGDADNGALIFEEACGQCHQLTPGLNKKGPQLMNIYGARAADLAHYNYSEGLAASNWVWDAKTLDPYIADAEKVIPDSKMLADPMPDAGERADVIAYLSTLRAPVPALDAEGFPVDTDSDNADQPIATDKDKQIKPLRDKPIEIPAGAANKPAADFQ